MNGRISWRAKPYPDGLMAGDVARKYTINHSIRWEPNTEWRDRIVDGLRKWRGDVGDDEPSSGE